VVAAVLLVFVRLALPALWPDLTIYGVLGGFAGAALILVWWLFFSRALWLERLGAIALMVAGLLVTRQFLDISISTGAMGGLLPLLALPPLAVLFVAWAVVTRTQPAATRWATMAATILVACGMWTLVKTGGFDGNFDNDLMWRWAATKEDRLVANPSAALPPAPPSLPTVDSRAPVAAERLLAPAASPLPAPAVAVVPVRDRAPAEWPGFRGPLRDGIARGVRIETDWARTPPVEIWRRQIGPGWASFAVQDDLLYTQEQRGDEEIVAAYNISTGKPVWSHRDPARFWESNGGAGPRATPTLHEGRVYSSGATGILNAMDARTGALVWSRNVAADAGVKAPMWGFSSSPLIAGDLVITAVSGTMAAYELATGKLRWIGPHHDLTENGSYSSPQRLVIDGVEQIVMFSEAGATGVVAADGGVLWEYARPGSPILQPVLTPDGDLLFHEMSMSGGVFIRRVALSHNAVGWKTEDRWTSDGLKTMFNDFVIHDGHAYGFDGSIFACVNLADGKRTWKRGRYGNGQVLLLGDQGVLLVMTEDGELALVDAKPDQFTELARFKAIEGKTWNHPVVVGEMLLVRNGEEMAVFRLARKN
jgi:outer membrane protein assembly factor BamB